MAGRAGRIDARHEEQLDADEAFALAGLAAALGDVEREAAGVVAARARGRCRREQLPHAVEEAGVGGEVRARRPADRLLVDPDQALDPLHAAGDVAVRLLGDARLVARRQVVVGGRRLVSEVAADQLDQRLADERRLARSRDAGHCRHHAERKGGVERAQVVARDAAQFEPALRLARCPALGLGRGEEVARGMRAAHLRQPVGRAAVEDAAAFFAGVGTDVDDPVGAPHRRQVVLDDEDRIAGALELVERGEQRPAVLRMQPGGRLVEHVDDAEQVRADLRRQPQPLQLAGRERRRAAREREIAEAERLERGDALDQVAGDALRDDPLFLRQVRRPAHVGRAGVRRAAGGDSARRVVARGGTGRGCVGAGLASSSCRPPCLLEATRCRRRQHLRHLAQRQLRQRADVEAGEGDGERLGLEPLAVADRAHGPVR